MTTRSRPLEHFGRRQLSREFVHWGRKTGQVCSVENLKIPESFCQLTHSNWHGKTHQIADSGGASCPGRCL